MPRLFDQYETCCGERDVESYRSLNIKGAIRNINIYHFPFDSIVQRL